MQLVKANQTCKINNEMFFKQVPQVIDKKVRKVTTCKFVIF